MARSGLASSIGTRSTRLKPSTLGEQRGCPPDQGHKSGQWSKRTGAMPIRPGRPGSGVGVGLAVADVGLISVGAPSRSPVGRVKHALASFEEFAGGDAGN